MLESLKTIVKTNSDKKLFDGDLEVSYGEFYNLVRQDMASQDNRKHVISTHSLLNQLVRFVSKLCQKALPIICKPNLTHNEISRLEKEVQYAPQLADFGVLSSGTTADAKLLWRASLRGLIFLAFRMLIFRSLPIADCLFKVIFHLLVT